MNFYTNSQIKNNCNGVTLKTKQETFRYIVLSVGAVQTFSLAGTVLLHDKPDNI